MHANISIYVHVHRPTYIHSYIHKGRGTYQFTTINETFVQICITKCNRLYKNAYRHKPSSPKHFDKN